MTIFEAALPEEIAAPYRATLTKLQEAAPPMPAATVHAVLAETSGGSGGDGSQSFDDTPGRGGLASARCTARSGRTAATSR